MTDFRHFLAKKGLHRSLEEVYFLACLSLRGQTVLFVHCKKNPQQAKIRCFVKSATLLLFWIFVAVLASTSKYLKHCDGQNRSKTANMRNPQLYLRNPKQFVESTNK